MTSYNSLAVTRNLHVPGTTSSLLHSGIPKGIPMASQEFEMAQKTCFMMSSPDQSNIYCSKLRKRWWVELSRLCLRLRTCTAVARSAGRDWTFQADNNMLVSWQERGPTADSDTHTQRERERERDFIDSNSSVFQSCGRVQ